MPTPGRVGKIGFMVARELTESRRAGAKMVVRARLLVLAVAAMVIAAAGAARADGPNGLYLMTRMWPGAGLETKGWFFRDGQVSQAPQGDLDRFDFRAAAAAKPNVTGRYTLGGDKMTVAWANGKTTTAEVEPGTDGCFFWDMGLFCPARPFPADTRLDGVFTGGASAGGGAVASARTLKLGADGRYTLDSLGAVSAGVTSAGSTAKESGTYAISGTRLDLRPDGGQPRQVLVFPYDDGSRGPQPRRLYFDGGMLKQQAK